MRITKHQLRRIISESFAVPDSRLGFLGPGFGTKQNHYDPYAKHHLHEEEATWTGGSDLEDGDGWAGGDSRVNPVDNLKADTGLENVAEPETLELALTEKRLRQIVRHALSRILL